MDIFRKEYRTLTEPEKKSIENIKILAEQLYEAISGTVSDPRSNALARTKLEEAVMWAVKGITA